MENEQIDKAMVAMGTAQNLRKEEDTRRVRALLAGELKTKVRYLGSRLTWNLSFATERETGLAAAWNAHDGPVLEGCG